MKNSGWNLSTTKKGYEKFGQKIPLFGQKIALFGQKMPKLIFFQIFHVFFEVHILKFHNFLERKLMRMLMRFSFFMTPMIVWIATHYWFTYGHVPESFWLEVGVSRMGMESLSKTCSSETLARGVNIVRSATMSLQSDPEHEHLLAELARLEATGFTSLVMMGK